MQNQRVLHLSVNCKKKFTKTSLPVFFSFNLKKDLISNKYIISSRDKAKNSTNKE